MPLVDPSERRTLFATFVALVLAMGTVATAGWTFIRQRDLTELDRRLDAAAGAAGRLLQNGEVAPLIRDLELLVPGAAVGLTVVTVRSGRAADGLAEQAARDRIAWETVDDPAAGSLRRLAVRAATAARGEWARVVVASSSLRRLEEEWAAIGRLLAIFVVVVASGGTAGVLFVLRSYRRPVEAVVEVLAARSEGGPPIHVVPHGPDAVRRLGQACNATIDRHSARISELTAARAFLDLVLRRVPQGLVVVDARGVIERANPAAERLLGEPEERLRGRLLLAILLDYDLDRTLGRVLRSPAECESAAPVVVTTPDDRALRLTVAPITLSPDDRGGERQGAVVVLEDLTELRRVESMRRDFVSNLGHELRTPVAALRALVETVLLRRNDSPELAAELLPRAVAECERIDRLVSDLSLLADAESRREPSKAEAISLRACAVRVLLSLEPVAPEARRLVRLEAFEPDQAWADPDSVEQILRNLLENALRYAPGAAVRVSSQGQDGEIRLCVEDEGPGIERRHLARIFERFYRADPDRSRATGGSGLGLSIVRHLAEAQGGRVWVESAPGQGTRFFVSLPRPGDPSTASEDPGEGSSEPVRQE